MNQDRRGIGRGTGPRRVVALGALVMATAALGGACGDDGGGETEEPLPDCGLETTLAGDATARYTIAGSRWACGIPFSGGSGISMVFIAVDDGVGSIEIRVDEVTEGTTGTFPATARITSREGDATWSTDGAACSVEIAEHEATGEEDEMTLEYLVVGTGSCAGPAAPLEGNDGAPITVGDFAFRFPARWTKGSS